MAPMKKPALEGKSGAFSRFVLAHKWFFIFFIPFLAIQLFSISFLPWDSIPYVFQGKWFCGEQVYLELIRPPVPGFFNCIFGAQLYSIVISTAFAALLYLAGILLLYKKSPKLYDQFTLALFAFLLPPILFASNYGSDLFALAFLILAIAVVSPKKKGFLFGLSSLSRYNFLVFGVVFLWQLRKEPKKLPVLFLTAFITWIPWLIFNYFYSGDPFFSLNETTYLNIFLKGVSAPIGIEQYVLIVVFLIVLFIAGFKRFKDNALSHSALLNIGQFFISAVKETRFINLVTPALAFNVAQISKRRFLFKTVFVGLFVIAFAGMLWPFFTEPTHYDSIFKNDSVPSDSFLFQCRVASDKWVLFYPQGIVAQFLPDSNRFNEYLNKGTVLVVYDYNGVDLNAYKNVINRGEYVIIKPDTCAPQVKRYISGAWNYKVVSWIRDHNYWVSDLRDWPE